MLKDIEPMKEPVMPEKPNGQKESILARTIWGVLLLAIGAVMAVIFFANDKVFLCTIFTALAGIGFVILKDNSEVEAKNNECDAKMLQYSEDVKKYEKLKEQYEQNKKDIKAYKFYALCVNKDVDITDEKNVKMLANNIGVYDYEQAKKLYEQGENFYLLDNKEANDRKRQEERNEYSEIVAKTRIVGKDKYTGRLKGDLEYSETMIGLYGEAAGLSEGRSRQKAQTSDWAVAGGMASGIAGSAAGLATAYDIQRKNAVAEANAARAREEAFANFARFRKYEQEEKSKVEMYRRMLNEINEKVIDFDEVEEKFKNIDVKVEKWTVSKATNNMRIKLAIKCDKDIPMLNFKAFLDGSLKIVVKENGTVVSDTYYSAPGFDILNAEHPWFAGVGFGNVTSGETLAIGPFKEDVDYEFEIRPYKLWLIEK